MNEQITQSIISDLGNTIAQLTIDLAYQRAYTQELMREIQELKESENMEVSEQINE